MIFLIRLKFIFFCILATVNTSANDTFCENTDGLEKIKAHLICQADPDINSCAGLYVSSAVIGAAVGYTTPKVSYKILKNMRLNDFNKAKQEITEDIASKLHHERWAYVKDARYPDDYKKIYRELISEAPDLKTKIDAYVRSGQNPYGFGIEDYRAPKGGYGINETYDIGKRLLKKDELEAAVKAAADKMSGIKKDNFLISYGTVSVMDPPNSKLVAKKYPLIVTLENGKYYDIVNSKYSDLPQSRKLEYKKSLEVVVKEIGERIKSGLPLDEYFIHSTAYKMNNVEQLKMNKEYRKIPGTYKLSSIELERYSPIIKVAISSFNEFENKSNTSPLRKALVRLSNSPKIKGAMAGSIFTVGLTALFQLATNEDRSIKSLANGVLSDITMTTNTGCSMQNDDKLNLDSNCRFAYEVNENVFNFLESDQSVQKNLLRDSRVCSYYKGLKDKLHSTNSILPMSSIACSKTSITISNSKDRSEKKYKIYLNDKKQIQKVSEYVGTFQTVTYRFEDEKVINADVNDASQLRHYNSIKKVLADVKTCCISENDQCISKLVISDTATNKSSLKTNSTGIAR